MSYRRPDPSNSKFDGAWSTEIFIERGGGLGGLLVFLKVADDVVFLEALLEQAQVDVEFLFSDSDIARGQRDTSGSWSQHGERARSTPQHP